MFCVLTKFICIYFKMDHSGPMYGLSENIYFDSISPKFVMI